ncbi:MAG TPA: hypothetical protein VH560_14020 [Polyangia bacterium]|nr:hypothetical protein [Polyangia bacterium]
MLHMPFAAPLLRKVMPGGICPIMRGTPEQIDRAHAVGATAIRASASAMAPVRPALGFTLDTSTKTDVAAWAKGHDVTCKSIAGNETLQRCTDVPAAAVGEPDDLGPLEEATFEFNASGWLVNVQTLRRRLSGAKAATTASALEIAAVAALGTPTTLAGQPTAAHLSSGQLATYVAAHVFRDYRATISATNLAPTGVMVREEYLSAR